MSTQQRVLVATDGETAATAAQALLERLGAADRLALTTFSVATHSRGDVDRLGLLAGYLPELAPTEAAPGADPEPATDESPMPLGAGDYAEEAAARARTAGFAAEPKWVAGHAAHKIVAEIRDGEYGLAVIGAGHHAWLGGILLGSTSNFVLHNAPSSVLVAHTSPHHRERYRVLVATDGSDGAEGALVAMENFADPDRCHVTVLCVAGHHHHHHLDTAETDWQEAALAAADEVAAKAAARLGRCGFEAVPLTMAGPPAHTILQESATGEYDLVVVGSHGLGPERRAMLGSVAANVARHAPAALLGRIDVGWRR